MRARTSGPEMDLSAATPQLSDAAGGSAAHTDVVRSSVTGFLGDRSGVTAIEYGLMVCFMTLVIVGAISTLGSQTFTQLFSVISSSL
ncbi:MAG TPA: Flp family type IVb pilin [Rhizomicrobium sp.]